MAICLAYVHNFTLASLTPVVTGVLIFVSFDSLVALLIAAVHTA